MRFLITMCCLVLFSVASWAQRVITGQIIDSEKEPLIGAAVLQKGTTTGTTTDIDGNFSLSVSDTGKVVLVVSYVGLPTKEIDVAPDQTMVSINMEPNAKELDEVVVVGYGTVRKSDLTGSVSSLKPDDVRQVPSQSAMEAIQGKAAGVDITRTNGSAGSAPNIVIRGTRSISATNEPLYIVDGVQYSGIQDINPGDIMSMEVLKDASSTAIYGSRGANGVVIITTKKGAAGEFKVTVNSYYGVSTPGKFPRSMNGQEYIDLRRQALRTQAADAAGGVDDPNLDNQNSKVAQEMQNLANGTETNYIKELLHNGTQKDLQVGIAGGNDKLRSYFSLGYYNETGLLKNDEIKRYTGRLNLDYTLNKFIKVGTQTQITSYDQLRRVNPFGVASNINPLTKPFNEAGDYDPAPGINGFNTGPQQNPLIDEKANTAVDKEDRLRIFPTVYLEVSPLKGLTGRTNMSLTWDDQSRNVFQAANSYGRFNQKSLSSHAGTFSRNINWQGIINYSPTLGKNHSLNLTAISEILDNKSEIFTASGENQLIAEQSYYNLAGNNENIKISSLYRKNTLVSFAGRVNYSLKGKYLLTLTGREDGASQLSEGQKWDFFPSVAAAWRVGDEQFLEKVRPVFSNIKLRASWGIAGNAAVRPYSTQSLLSYIPFGFDNTQSLAYGYDPQIGNDALRWEKTTTYNVGLDLGFFKDRITATVDYYDARTRDLLLTRALPASTGVVQTVQNVGRTRNRGVEVTLSSVNIETKRFRWSTTLTFMKNIERVTELVNDLPYMSVPDDDGNVRIVAVNAPVNSFYDYEKIGLWQTGDADAIAAHNAANPTYLVRAGDIRIKDQNGDGRITADDRLVVGSQVPKWSGGLNSEFKFMNFDLSLYFYARVGNTINFQGPYDPNGNRNSISTREYWTPENQGDDLPRPGRALPAEYRTTINYMDGTFYKLRNVMLGYTIPDALTKKLRISRLRVYVTGKNLFVISNVKDYDPEMNGAYNLPLTRLYVAGFNLEF